MESKQKLSGEKALRAELVWTQTQLMDARKENLSLRVELLNLQLRLLGSEQAELLKSVDLDVTKIQREEDGSFTLRE